MSRGVLLRKSADQVIENQTNEVVDFDVVDYDTDSFRSGSRIVIPAGVGRVRLTACAVWRQNQEGMRQLVVKKNGAFFPGGAVGNLPAVAMTTTDHQIITAPINVVTGDYFELVAYQYSGVDIALLASTGTWFCLEVLG